MSEKERKKGGCLTAFLIFMLIANALGALGYFIGGGAIRQLTPNIPGWAIITSGTLSLLNIIFALGIWKFKKWGFYGFGAVSVIAFVVNIISGTPVYSALIGLVGIVILYFLVRPIWSQME